MDERSFSTAHVTSTQDVVDFYERYARDWDSRFGAVPSTEYFLDRRWRSLATLVDEQHRGRAVELGVGTGVYLGRARRLFNSIIAVDGSQAMLEEVKKRLDRERLQSIEVLQGDVVSLPQIPDGSVDCVYFFGLIEHVLKPEALVREIRRMLASDGVVIGVTPNRRSPWYTVRRLVRGTGSHCSTDHLFTSQELTHLFTKEGFSMERVSLWGMVPAGLHSPLIFGLLRFLEPIMESLPVVRSFLGGISFRARKRIV